MRFLRRLLLRLYPKEWRERYGEEFEALLEGRRLRIRDLLDILRGAIDAQIRLRMRREALPDLARSLFWLIVGAMFGVAIIGILSIGAPFLLVALLLLAVGGRRWGFRGAGAALVGLGALPAIVLARDILTAPPPCVGQIQPGQECGQIPGSYTVMAVVFGCIAVIGFLSPLIRGHNRLALGAAIAAGLATIAWSVQHVVSPVATGQACSGSSSTGIHCTITTSPSLWSQGDPGAIAANLAPGIVVAILLVAATYVRVRSRSHWALVFLSVMATLLLFYGTLNGTVVAALPGVLAIVAALAASGTQRPAGGSEPAPAPSP